VQLQWRGPLGIFSSTSHHETLVMFVEPLVDLVMPATCTFYDETNIKKNDRLNGRGRRAIDHKTVAGRWQTERSTFMLEEVA
jgi:hypothetical protein